MPQGELACHIVSHSVLSMSNISVLQYLAIVTLFQIDALLLFEILLYVRNMQEILESFGKRVIFAVCQKQEA